MAAGGAGRPRIAPPEQHLLCRIAERIGERPQVIEPQPDMPAFETRQLLLGNSRQPGQFGTAHAARFARVVETGEVLARLDLSRHGLLSRIRMITASLQNGDLTVLRDVTIASDTFKWSFTL